MADNMGVLGEATATAVGTTTVYTVPAGKAAKIRVQGIWRSGANSDLGILINGQEVARSGAMTDTYYTWTPGGAGLLTTPTSAKPDGLTAAKTVQPAAPIFYLSAGDTLQYTVTTTALAAANCQAVGVEVDLT